MDKVSQVADVNPELRRWIVEQAQAGCHPDAVLKAMLASGWDEAVAIRALEDTLQGYLDDHAEAHGMPGASEVPVVQAECEANVWQIGGRELSTVVALREPRVVVFSGFLADDECEGLMDLAARRLARSQTVDVQTGGNEVNSARTSEGMFFSRGENELCSRIEARIASLLSWPVENGEGLQVLRYRPGAEYLPHYDYFDPAQAGTPAVLRRGGQRVATLVMYLNTPTKGGATVFPDAGLSVAPIKGHAVFFSYDRPHPVTRTLHGGAPVLEGEKWVATKWLRQRRFE